MTQKKTKQERYAKIDQAIEASIAPSPDSAHSIAEQVDEHPTLVARRLHKRFVFTGGRWKRRESEEEQEGEQ